ncbi:MAG: right-handed parallel beta-helix repeat-containing protein [Bacteroidetes bacterium]|nr:right-handed parallel beta-helix repeat-containing protein [Bacteroidota bacterium]
MKTSAPSTALKVVQLTVISILFLSQNSATAQNHSWAVALGVTVVDGNSGPYSAIKPGDTILLQSGTRDQLLLRNCKGTAAQPVLVMNTGGVTQITTAGHYGISINNCRYLRFTGTGLPETKYGISIDKVNNGAGIGIGNFSSDIEVDHVSITNCSTEGIFAKTDPDCSFASVRDSFTMYNTSIHDNYIADVANEGMYIGSSYYTGITLHCNGKDTVVLPPVLDHIKVYNNIVKRTGWDGIQVSAAPKHCYIFNNTVEEDSQAGVPNQMSGIIMGGGSKCDCYNNLIKNGKGDGIEMHGLGGSKMYNNIIVNAGRSFVPNDMTQMKHGIFVSDATAMKDSSFYILFNDIINPKSDGIRFQSVKTKNNIIASNLIINPGNYSYNQTTRTSFTAKDAYIMLPDIASDVKQKNNFFTQQFSDAGISNTDFKVQTHSPLINKGYDCFCAVLTDFYGQRRQVGSLYDIGAVEYSGGSDTLLYTFDENTKVFPNPATNTITLQVTTSTLGKATVSIFNCSGILVLQQSITVTIPGEQIIPLEIKKLQRGLYTITVSNTATNSKVKFLKL